MGAGCLVQKVAFVKWTLRSIGFALGLALGLQLSLPFYLPPSLYLQPSLLRESSAQVDGLPGTDHQYRPSLIKHVDATQPHNNLRHGFPKLGVLIDTGRHEFSLDWIYDLIDTMAHLNLTILHVRLSDDQRLVDIKASFWPKVARFAASKSIQILPEVNVPSHAMAWDDLAVSCPKLACQKAFGIPLNVSHPRLWTKLDELLQWTINTFQPTILHMGGDEVHVNGGACLQEATGLRTQDYETFEQSLGDLLQSKYHFGPERILRWERTDMHHKATYRYGDQTHYWSSMPISTLRDAFVSTSLYWDVINSHDYEPDAFRVYTIGRRYKEQRAIIAGTFELNAELWRDRNVVGKLVALSLARNEYTDRDDFDLAYNISCRSVLTESVCQRMGLPMLSNDKYRVKHSILWNNWRRNACEKYNETIDRLDLKRNRITVKFG